MVDISNDRMLKTSNYEPSFRFVFFFNDTATTEIYTLSLHDALPISCRASSSDSLHRKLMRKHRPSAARSEEHTSELQSRLHLVCRLLLEKKKKSLRDLSTDRSRRRGPGRPGGSR